MDQNCLPYVFFAGFSCEEMEEIRGGLAEAGCIMAKNVGEADFLAVKGERSVNGHKRWIAFVGPDESGCSAFVNGAFDVYALQGSCESFCFLLRQALCSLGYKPWNNAPFLTRQTRKNIKTLGC